MTDRWERLTDLYHAVAALPEDDRASLLTEACVDDPLLQADVERLVAAHDRASRPVAPPAVAPTAVTERVPEPADEVPPRPTDRYGPYRLLKVIGHGRLGAVHLAVREDGRSDQRVSITAVETSPGAELAFDGLRAAHDVLDAHNHPNIARLIATATSDRGQPYAVTEYIDGEPVDAFADGRRLSVGARLQLFVQVCGAVSFAHRCGVTHGALQQATIVVTHDGLPKLVHFGVAPDATPADDVRSLGGVLDALLGGDGPDSPPARLQGELGAIVATALGHDTRRRYQSVDELADDVRRSLDSLMTRARRDNRRGRSATSARRYQRARLAWAVAGIAVGILGTQIVRIVRQPTPLAAVTMPAEAPTLRNRVVVADLTDNIRDPQLVAMLSDAFRTGVSESPAIVVLPTRRQRVDVQIRGSVDSVAGAISIALQVTRSTKGEQPPALGETISDSSDVLPALSRLSQRLREQLGERAETIAENPRLDDVTTASLPALRAYANGSKAIAGGDRAGGLRLLAAAVTLDTGYASAYRLMSSTYAELGDRERSANALDHVIANQGRLPFYARYHTVGSHALTVLAQYAAAVDAYNRLLERYPDDIRALDGLGRAYAARREYAVQESLLVRAIAVDSGVPSLFTSLALARVNQAKYDEARRTLDAGTRRFPGSRGLGLAAISLAAAKQDWESAEREAGARIIQGASDTADAVDAPGGLETLAAIRMTQGRLGEAERDLKRVIASGTRPGASPRALAAAVRLAYIDLRYRRSKSAALGTMNTALARYPLAKIPESDRPYDEVARLFADAGQPARAVALLTESARMKLRRPRADDSNRRWTIGAIAVAEGRAWEGEIQIHGAAEDHVCPICALPDLARAYEVAGKPDSAIATYERYLRTSWQRRFETDATELGFAMERLGALYQQQRDNTKAAALYTALLQLWRRADPELEPLLADVRRRLEQTGGAGVGR
jgi:tetratricopeptide (TPR) repeat protein